MTTIHLVQTSAGAPEAYDAVDENGNIVGYLGLRNGWFAVNVSDVQVYGAAIDGDKSSCSEAGAATEILSTTPGYGTAPTGPKNPRRPARPCALVTRWLMIPRKVKWSCSGD